MELEIEPRLAEEAVFLVLRSHERAGRESEHAAYHRELDAAYDADLDAETRAARFTAIHARWFARLGLEDYLARIVGEFPLLALAVERIRFAFATASAKERGELYVSATGRVAAVTMRPERFDATSETRTWLRREFLHVCDMVDPAFAYEPDLGCGSAEAPEIASVRDRYHALWSYYVNLRIALRDSAACPDSHVDHGLLDAALGVDSRKASAFIEARTEASSPVRHDELAALARGLCVPTEAARRSTPRAGPSAPSGATA